MKSTIVEHLKPEFEPAAIVCSGGRAATGFGVADTRMVEVA